MTRPDRKASDEAHARRARERIAAELEALGEEPLADDEDALDVAKDVDIATVQTLAGWADTTSGPDDELSELAQARVWRTIELRSKPDAEPAPSPSPSPRRSRPLVLTAVVAVLAVAAGVVLVPVLSSEEPEPATPLAQARQPEAPAVTAEELEVLSTQSRAGLAALDRLSGQPHGSERAAAMAAEYARRLEAEG